ncbi:hypothetical protein K32_34820 [Kaistia sp. 32K]|uniref:DUF1344 domain-containing protein n=1 Tax=Kaistia sp. 32K TaxID=2795690 RepID=UPI0019156320|nr:DUF1344 domain-containing protein [Kaistia sp. 32K]BCP54865.1 hypothetical protein K32_34820 [Kaistia sp. 32K]
MKMHILLGAVLVTAGLAGPAAAAETQGTIKSVNPKTDSITLSDGKTFVLSEGVEAETLKAGEKVKVTYATTAGKMTASKVQIVK